MVNNETGERTLGKAATIKWRWLVVVLSALGLCILGWLIVTGPLDDFLWPLPPGWGNTRVAYGEAQLFAQIRNEHVDEGRTKLCEYQVLFVPHPESRGERVGGGMSGGATSRGRDLPPLLDYELRWRIKLDDDTEQMKRAAISYDPSDQTLKVGGKQFEVAKINLFCVLLDEEWNVKETIQLDEFMSEQAGLADFKRLLPNEPAVQAITQ